MRASFAPLASDRLTFVFEGREIEGRKGETVAAALTAAGILSIRRTRKGSARGLFCGMGVCQDCLVEIDGTSNQRACMTKLEPGMRIAGQELPRAHRPKAPASSIELPQDCDVLVVGGGPAGLSAAAVAAEAGIRVVLVDDRPVPGGQFYKQPIPELPLPRRQRADVQFSKGRDLIARARAAGIEIVRGTVLNAALPPAVVVESEGRAATVRSRRLILATGAFERARPVPGWTLPGVMTTGAAQTLLRSYGVVVGRRVLIAGNGPLNLQVALELHRAGATIIALLEAAPRPGLCNLRQLARMAISAPALTIDGMRYVAALKAGRIPFLHAAAIDRIEAGDQLTATLMDGRSFAADVVCMGYGFLPSNELARLLGCRHHYDAAAGCLRTTHDENCRTSIDAVFAIGDATGLGGARAAEAEGIIAGLTAAIDIGASPSAAALNDAMAARASLGRQRRFQQALWQLFKPIAELADGPPAEAIICRCEEIEARSLEEFVLSGAPIGSIKRATRLAMGRCQGRYCGPLAVDMLARQNGRRPSEADFPAPRPPIKPVPIEVLAGLDEKRDWS
jgi:D-hydroxyproline dehydrogenase subunit alpha